MYGLEKKPSQTFLFDLEKKIKETPSLAKEMLAKAERRMTEIKKQLREGAKEKEYDRLGILLNAYVALQKVLKKVAK